MTSPEPVGDDCERCHHPFNPHILVAVTDDPLDGGFIICPVPECECYATWSPEGRPAPEVDQEAVMEFRRRLREHQREMQ